MGIELISVK